MIQQGKLIEIMPVISGQTERGTWTRGGFVIETDEQYPRQLAFSVFGEIQTSTIAGFSIGDDLKVEFHPVSRKWNDKWFSELKCSNVIKKDPDATQSINNSAYNQNNTTPAPSASQFNEADSGTANNFNEEDDDLPF